MLAPGTRIAGKYELERQLGSGGMGVVWLARHVELGERRVAIKFLLNTMSAELLARFRREAMVATQIQTRHAVAVLDFGQHDGAPYLVMEYLAGQDLRGLLEQRRRLEPALALTITEQAARGLQKAHDAGLIHRDIKPENVFLTQDEDGELLVKILDFGIAKSLNAESCTATGMMIGTVYYMSPEQFQGLKALDHRTDVWSLACVAYEMLVGERTFGADSVLMIGMKILGEDRPVPSRVVAGLPPGFDAWFAKALHPNISKRFASADELSATLASALGTSSANYRLPQPNAAPASSASRDVQFSTTASATSAVDSDRPPPPKRGAMPMLPGVVGVATVAAVGLTAFLVLRTSEDVLSGPAGLVSSAESTESVASSAPAGSASSAPNSAEEGDRSLLSRVSAMVGEGDLEAAHRLLVDLPNDSPLRSDERFMEAENAWADLQLSKAEKERNVVEKATMLIGVTKSGADETRKARAKGMLEAMSRTPSSGKAGKTGKGSPPKVAPPATTKATAPSGKPPKSTGALPPRY